jgi:hypothetical protein
MIYTIENYRKKNQISSLYKKNSFIYSFYLNGSYYTTQISQTLEPNISVFFLEQNLFDLSPIPFIINESIVVIDDSYESIGDILDIINIV